LAVGVARLSIVAVCPALVGLANVTAVDASDPVAAHGLAVAVDARALCAVPSGAALMAELVGWRISAELVRLGATEAPTDGRVSVGVVVARPVSAAVALAVVVGRACVASWRLVGRVVAVAVLAAVVVAIHHRAAVHPEEVALQIVVAAVALATERAAHVGVANAPERVCGYTLRIVVAQLAVDRLRVIRCCTGLGRSGALSIAVNTVV
jgi:hypothetical protein